ncbi:demethoxyubiquinone hydroxylase family protein [Marinicauda salina]|uniref:3-demethoxyubiquinol 3-hydroxylase n=1 Tax=Marinicauda salina TaxID=2135793 RepID=A0A2U2BS78_9PROT|nr:demethoxyubiquinone hydroxylase family protein [Marinicauda salina]PWE16865.1 demethoxyubiquinone hydroxylase family protein [Marinicauda salina]
MSFERKTVRRPGNVRSADRTGEMIRVDHAGEYGAVQIYKGQRAVFARLPEKARIAGQLKRMEADEQHHLDAFDKLLMERKVRPTALGPIWNVAGYGLGVVTALMGEKAAHACTEAVESVIEGHYDAQVEELEAAGETELAATFARFRDEETEHKDLAVGEGAKEAIGYPLLSAAIKAGCRLAIRVSEKV